MTSPTIVLLLKAPRPNEVKTRLAATVGPARAVSIYRQMVASLLRVIPAPWPVRVYYSPADAAQSMRDWLSPHAGPALSFHAQAPGDLGARLHHAFADTFESGATDAIALGGDCPALDFALLDSAATQLSSHDVVLGPAMDGGYYLLGLRAPQPVLFENMPWSTSQVLPETQRRLRKSGLRTALLPVLSDVDDEDGWRHAVAAGQLEA